MNYYLAMDIGGTKTSAALFAPDGTVVDGYIYTKESKTYSGEDAVYENSKGALLYIIEKFNIDMDDILGIGVGCPGPLDTKRGVIIHAPLMRWRNFPLVDRLKNDFMKPVAMDKDCNLGALAEQRIGLARGLENVIYMTVSTGVGAGIIIGGKIYHGRTDSAGEFGHITYDENGLACPCGNRGCLELYCSGTAIKRTLKADAEKNIKSLVFEWAGGDESKLDAKLLSAAAEKKDPYALELFDRVGRILGFGIANVFNMFDPDIVVIGGGVSKSRRFYCDALLQTVKSRSIIRVEDRHIVYSELCDTVVLHGAYHLIKDLIEKGDETCH
jgi:glucokinase